MGLLSDALRHLLATDPASRRAGLAGLVGRVFGADPVLVGHVEVNGKLDQVDLVHFPKSGAGLTPRGFAITMTLGLSETQQRELLVLTLADARDPARYPMAWLLGAIGETPRGAVTKLPAGCLGRSAHDHALITDPWPLSERELPDYERVVGGRLDLVVPITEREASWATERGATPFVDAMRAQAVMPYADRPAGETTLPA